jgi:hypothetical protein
LVVASAADRCLDTRRQDFEAKRQAARDADPDVVSEDGREEADAVRRLMPRFQAEADFDQIIVSAVLGAFSSRPRSSVRT